MLTRRHGDGRGPGRDCPPPLLRQALGAEPIKIGAILHLTGPLSPYGLEQKRTLELFVKQRNARGGIIGRTLQLIIEDDGGRAQVSVEKARKLVDLLSGCRRLVRTRRREANASRKQRERLSTYIIV
ncbi:MAG: ABC transporter substrate-binding protein [Betaproteobacteria bacterium]|nr:ABC transporter substrate-binding protein [Betaproteobacteria bacterium]